MLLYIFVGDGDSIAYKTICQLNDGRGPYEVPVTKEECVNHVSKRMGARLRKIEKSVRNNQGLQEEKEESIC